MTLPSPQELEATYRLGGVRGSWRLNWNGTIHALNDPVNLDWFDRGYRGKAICGTSVTSGSWQEGCNLHSSVDVKKVCRRCARIGKLPA